MNLEEFQYIWTTNREEYVLVKVKSDGYAIFNKADSTALIIEDDDIYEAVIKKMLDNGCEVLERIG
ncbi:hypothetical protein [Brevibacillus migulae]|uniref:hypothetical protein n=1 Tax=Brevibacillus migulae TaxID=1644114 RepID=UPI001430E187|nr:hypothetical protein [Brevibacillus migulae]